VHEVEAKFLLQRPEQYSEVLRALTDLGFSIAPETASETIVDRYLDTPDWRIYQRGWAYRLRASGGHEKRTLKAIAHAHRSAVFVREEIEETLPAADALHVERSGPVATRLHSMIDSATPHELFRVRTERRRRVLQGPGERPLRLELALDETQITAQGSQHLRFAELELELLEGERELLAPLAQTLTEEAGLLPAQLSKFERGLHVAHLKTPSDHALKRPRLNEPMIMLAYFCLAEQAETLERQVPLAWEGLDTEGVHSMRVAVRRSRAALRAFKRLLPPAESRVLDRDLKWLSQALGIVRDLDVERMRLEHVRERMPAHEIGPIEEYLSAIDEQTRAARRELISTLSSERFAGLLGRLRTFLDHAPAPAALRRWGSFRIADGAERAIGAALKHARKRGKKALREQTPEALHALRIAGKQLRYTLEFFAPYYADHLEDAAHAARTLQDALGKYQDANLSRQHLARYIARSYHAPTQQYAELVAANGVEAATAHRRFRTTWRRFRKSVDRPLPALGGTKC
jgi:triphosphatase